MQKRNHGKRNTNEIRKCKRRKEVIRVENSDIILRKATIFFSFTGHLVWWQKLWPLTPLIIVALVVACLIAVIILICIIICMCRRRRKRSSKSEYSYILVEVGIDFEFEISKKKFSKDFF